MPVGALLALPVILLKIIKVFQIQLGVDLVLSCFASVDLVLFFRSSL